jgi:DNA-directed RNA polymerase beta subunit
MRKQILMILITYQTVVRTVGEQLSQQFGVGLARMARTIRERMNVRDNEVFTPIDLINAKTLSSVINSLEQTIVSVYGSNESTCRDTHKRRLSALGPGGLSRERAGLRYVMFTIRTTDVYVLLKHQRDQTLV